MPKIQFKTNLDDTPLRFGKYKGRTPRQVSLDDPGYIVWLGSNTKNPPVSRDLVLECEFLTQDTDQDFDDPSIEDWARRIADE